MNYDDKGAITAPLNFLQLYFAFLPGFATGHAVNRDTLWWTAIKPTVIQSAQKKISDLYH